MLPQERQRAPRLRRQVVRIERRIKTAVAAKGDVMLRLIYRIQLPGAPSGVSKEQDLILVEMELSCGPVLVSPNEACTVYRSRRSWSDWADGRGVLTAGGSHKHRRAVVTRSRESGDPAQLTRERSRIIEATELTGPQDGAEGREVAGRKLAWAFHISFSALEDARGLTICASPAGDVHDGQRDAQTCRDEGGRANQRFP